MKKLLKWGAIGLVALVVLAMMFGGDDDKPAADAPAAATVAPEPTEAPASSAAAEPTAPVVCSEIGPIVLADLASGLNAAGGSIARAAYVPATPPNSESSEQWYAVAAPLTGPGLDDTTLTWVTSADLPADSVGGSWFSADNLTKEFNVYPMPDAVADWARSSADPDNARGCVESQR